MTYWNPRPELGINLNPDYPTWSMEAGPLVDGSGQTKLTKIVPFRASFSDSFSPERTTIYRGREE